MLFIFQWIFYGIEYLVKIIKYRNHDTAYRNLSFEREAYANELIEDYLKSRKRFEWVKHL